MFACTSSLETHSDSVYFFSERIEMSSFGTIKFF